MSTKKVLIAFLCITLTLGNVVTAISIGSSVRFQREESDHLFVINTKPPSVQLLAADTLESVAKIDIEKDPTAVVLGPDHRFLYVLHGGLFRPEGGVEPREARLSIVGLDAGRAVRTIPLGRNVMPPLRLKDGRYLLYQAIGQWDKARAKSGIGSVVVLDTQTNEITATLRVPQLGQGFVATDDLSRVFVLGGPGMHPLVRGKFPKGESSIVRLFTGVTGGTQEPVAEMSFPNYLVGMALSTDEKWLYVLDSGYQVKAGLVAPKNAGNGTVHVIDVSTGQRVASHAVGAYPSTLAVDPDTDSVAVLARASSKDMAGRVYTLRGTALLAAEDIGQEARSIVRIASTPGRYALSYEQMRPFGEDGKLSSSTIVLNAVKGKPRPPEAGPILDDYPGEVLALGDTGKAAIAVVNKLGGPTDQVAIVDLNRSRVDRVITTGRSGVRRGKMFGAIALTVAAGVGAGLAAGALGLPGYVYPVFGPGQRNITLAATADGRILYVLNTRSSDVTAIDSETGNVLNKIAVGTARLVAVPPGSKYVVSFTDRQLTLIDTETNTRRLEHQLVDGSINGIHLDSDRRRILVFTTNSLLVVNAEKGQIEKTIGGFRDPKMIVSAQ
jgi:YVTN family beta-propeller protein